MEVNVKTETLGSQVNLQNLLRPTKHHPQGRVQIDPKTGEIINPRNNVIRIVEKMIIDDYGRQLGIQKIPVNGGHVLAEGTNWRIALGGPKKYHQKVMDDKRRHAITGKQDNTAPVLETEPMTKCDRSEAEEYFLYVRYIEEENLDLPENEDFWAWLKTKNAKVEIKGSEIVVTAKDKEPEVIQTAKRGRPKKS